AGALGELVVLGIVRATQDRARRREITPEAVPDEVASALENRGTSSLRPVLNATGVIIHTNLGRAPLSAAAREALQDAAGHTDVEFDLTTGARSRRGAAARAALLAACPAAEDALVVNNGAAALSLATTALAQDREVLWSRGELVEIGAGFRLADLVTATGVRVCEVGTTNRTHLADYTRVLEDDGGDDERRIGAVLKVHTSNYRVEGFTAEATIADLAGPCRAAGVPLIADLGSGLLHPDPALPEEPDATTALEAGADLVLTSGDKLFGGPQAGILLGRAEIIGRLARHALARAVRADKLTLAAIEATITGSEPPVLASLHADPEALRDRTEHLRDALGTGDVVPHDGRVGGGGGAGVPLPGWALRLPSRLAGSLRQGETPVVATVRDDACLVDLRCILPEDDEHLLAALRSALGADEEDSR
ncbi:MAG: L-seryl-tRNA(Sec) selenium transferase, partial [Brachybacterium sp.]|nr:L-seryl-tRNA(Sec) selenium transferase [Brachybacterium sp.]